MDSAVESQLRAMALPDVTLVSLAEVESSALREVKSGRTKGEYCWTLTPFLPSCILDRDPGIARVTYLDADLYFFRDPDEIFRELERSGSKVLITEHAYAREYDQAETAGRFCVQFVVFNNDPAAKEVLRWWQERCIEWCFARHEDGKFGDQKYLDSWPELFGSVVHILERKCLALAPWNARFYFDTEGPDFRPIFYHFHGLRLISPRRVRLWVGYRIGTAGQRLYDEYVRALRRARESLDAQGISIPYFPEKSGLSEQARDWARKVLGKTATASLGADQD